LYNDVGRHSHCTVGGRKALFWCLHHQQLQADMFASFLNGSCGVKTDIGSYWKLQPAEV